MTRNLYIYTTNNRKLNEIPEFVNSVSDSIEGDLFDLSYSYVYINLNEITFSNEFIKSDIENRRESSHFIYLIMKENYVEVRDLEHSFDYFYIALYKTVKNLLESYSFGDLDHQYWVIHFRERNQPFHDPLNT